MKDLRAYALAQLQQMETEGRYLGLSLSAVEPQQRGFLTALLYGIAEHKLTLDYYIGVLAKRSDIDTELRNILRIGLFQLLYLTHIPPHAVVDTTVGLVKKKSQAGFVNAVMRRAVREPECLVLPKREKNPLRYLSLYYSLPLPTLRLLVNDLGEAETEAYLKACSERAPLCLAVNTLRIAREQMLALLCEKGIKALPTPHAPHGILILDEMPVYTLPGYGEGLFYVQDEAAQMAVEALCPAENSLVVDACAAPGGKSFYAALKMGGKGSVISLELHESKLSLIKKGADRLGIQNIQAFSHDSRIPKEDYVGQADYVICDVPCSGLGVLRKKPEIRYKNTDDISAIPPLQKEILEASSRYLKKGGKLLYATCTLLSAENGDAVNAFLKEHSEYTLLPFSMGDVKSEGMLTLMPQTHGTDGFFIALMQRNK